MTDRNSRRKHKESYSDLKEIQARVPQGSVLGRVMYLLYSSDIQNYTISTFVDGKGVMAMQDNHEEDAENLQSCNYQIAPGRGDGL